MLSEEKDFWLLFKKELNSTLILYKRILKNPLLLIHGTFRVLCDIFYELPLSFFHKKDKSNLEQHLESSASQCITISEIVTIPGNYLWFIILHFFGFNAFFSSILGANIGDYFSSVLSYIFFYILLTRWHGNFYTTRNALYDCFEVIKDCFPAAAVLYIFEAPLISILLLIGFSPIIAIAINLVVAMTIYIWIAKVSTTSNIEKRFSK